MRANQCVPQCISNLKQIGLGLLNYESRYGCFPPAYVADAKGQPLYSWRVLLMADSIAPTAGSAAGLRMGSVSMSPGTAQTTASCTNLRRTPCYIARAIRIAPDEPRPISSPSWGRGPCSRAMGHRIASPT